jgi:ABC transporter substrate binding protein
MSLAGELVRLKVDVILTHNTPPPLAAKQATSVIPIVFATAGDPVGTGIVASLARLGGNITGPSSQQPDTAGKRVELLRESRPSARCVPRPGDTRSRDCGPRSSPARRARSRVLTASATHCKAEYPPPSCVDLFEQIDKNQSVPTNESTNMLEPDQWDAVLSRITGTVYRGTERVSSNALLNLLEVGPDPILRQKVAKRLRASMRRLGWTGPRAMRIPAENGHAAGSSGYWRLPSRPPQPDASVDGEVDTGLSDDLPAALEQVTRLGLKKLEKVLRVPLDPTDSNLVRSQVTAAGIAVNAQLRADEQRLRTKQTGDVLARLLKIIEEEKKIIEEEKNSRRRHTNPVSHCVV